MRVLSLIPVFTLLCSAMGCGEALPTDPVSVDAVVVQDSAVESTSFTAKKPLIMESLAYFNPGLFADPVNNPSWYGTLTHGEDTYGIIFWSLGSAKPFGADNIRGNAFFAAERWEMYDWLTFDPETQTFEAGELLMTGHAVGVQTVKQAFYRAHGRIDEAYGEFAMWAGRPMREQAQVFFVDGFPSYATGNLMVR